MRKYIFWGLLFIIMGTLWMLKMTGIISFTYRDILSLWPLILIWIGIGILPFKDIYKIILDVISMGIGIMLLMQPVQSCYMFQDINIEKDRYSVITGNVLLVDDVNRAKLCFNAGAAEIIFAKGDTALLDIVSANANNKANITFTRKQNNNRVEMDVKVRPKAHNVISGPYTVLLNPEPIWEMDIEVGATKNHIDLSAFKVENMKLDAGASDIYLKIGDIHPVVNIKLNMGATNMEVAVPSTMDCHIKKESGLTASTFRDFTEKEKGHYFSATTDSVNKGVINIEISSGVSNIVVTKY